MLNSQQMIDRRIKRALVETQIISLIGRLPIDTSLHTVNCFQKQSYSYNELSTFNQTKVKQYKQLGNELNLNRINASLISNFDNFKTIFNNMKDLVNGNNLIENGNHLIVEQKKEFSNGVCNGDR